MAQHYTSLAFSYLSLACENTSALLVEYPTIFLNHAMLFCNCVAEDVERGGHLVSFNLFVTVHTSFCFCQQIAGSRMMKLLQCIPVSPNLKKFWTWRKIRTSMSDLFVLCALGYTRIHAYWNAVILSAESVLLTWSRNDCRTHSTH